ncbi:PREDICTED: uncharacterized protein LOC100636424 isoform X2 [Amphimedon queenslandica]|uniref:Non-haem dioxygenase N-terminal domain-containing protein n=1 Tax=Amphimedon queenslandica TaxID=400682 RepID=A0AAN0JKP1_AMPQE|nr:PREDICTED: uncharacterized protein LOC100636424 isoform X2 [Amphimedon queenslandica]|eukprot:XP_019857326.1 PREDICTED: uncharacterized protein LOC100636424 isoform X2 [Amphimedon queenslandica]
MCRVSYSIERKAKAIEIFNTHHPLLSQSLSDPVSVAIMLQREGVITGQVLASVESASPSVPNQREVLLAAMREVIQNKYSLLQTFASVLCKFTGNLGAVIQRDYDRYLNDDKKLIKVMIRDDDSMSTDASSTESTPPRVPTVEIAIPQCMSDEFTSIQTSYGRMLYNIRKIIKKEPPPLDDVREYLCCCRSSLEPKLSLCSNITEILRAVEKECSLINVRLLQSLVEEFDIKEAEKLITEYKGILKEFCRTVKISLCLNEKFEALGGSPSLQCETVTYVFDWEPDEHMLQDIKQIISKTSGKLVKIKYIKKGNSIIVTCSFPHSLTGALIMKLNENLELLMKNGLMKLTVGYCTIWKKQKVQEIHSAFTTVGFVFITNHGIRRPLVDEAFSVAKKFFELPHESKKKYSRTSTSGNNGYIEMEQEDIDPTKPGDLKEAFNICSPTECVYPDDEVSDFKPVMTEILGTSRTLALKILEVMGHALKLQDPQFFVKNHQNLSNTTIPSYTTARVLYYPPLPSPAAVKPGQLRCGEHVDYGSITLLFQDPSGGLQI